MVLCLKIHAYLSLIRLLRSLVPNKGIICMPYKGSKELAYDKALIKKKDSRSCIPQFKRNKLNMWKSIIPFQQ